MSANPQIPRTHVHSLSEECANQAASFGSTARRLLDDQARLVRFFRANLPAMDGQSGEVSLYLLAVILRIFDRCGGRMGRVGAGEIEAATRRLLADKSVLPFDHDFPSRVRAVTGRAQPHILDEALHALFEREERREQEVEVDPEQAGRIFLLLWAATEALDAAWRAPTNPDWAEAGDGVA